jgi:hypothetical protein
MKRLLIRVVMVLAIVEVVYLAVVNVVLNLPATQTYLNQLRPDRVVYHWDRAWSWFPFRLQATGFTVNGQSWSQQWQMSAPWVTGSLEILPLFGKTIHFTGLETANIDVRFRPRPSPDRDDAALRQFYPPIPGRDPSLAAEPVPSQTPGWKTVFDVARVSGTNDVWLAATRMTLVGEARGTIAKQNQNGPLTISDGQADAAVTSFTIAGRQVTDQGSVKGTFDFATYLPQANRGLKVLAFLSVDADLDLPVDGLDFLDFFLGEVSNMKLAGKGAVKGHIAFNKGDLAAGTDLTITADNLTVDLAPYATSGAGGVAITVDAASPDTLAADFRFKTLSAFREPNHVTLFTGTDLEIAVARSTHILPGDTTEKVPRRVAVTIPKVTVPDITAYQSYLPDKWAVAVVGGSGSLDGHAEISAANVDFDLTLRSDNAEVKFPQSAFETGLEIRVKAKGGADAKTAQVDISGTSIGLDDSRVTNRQGDSTPWQTLLAVSEGNATFALPAESDAAAGLVGFWSLFRQEDLKAMLATVDGQLKASLTVSDLNWLNTLFTNPYALALYNAAEVEADVIVRSGWLAEGSTVRMPPRDFTVAVLDYVAEGNGGFDLSVEKGGAYPDMRLDANLANASLRLQDEKTAVIDQVSLTVAATAEAVSMKGGTVKTVQLDVPSAKVTDMAAYNPYLPEGSPIRILSGAADLAAQLIMEENTVGGFVKLKTTRVEADLDGERIAGTLTLDVPIKGGSAKDKTFDIAGASLALDDVWVTGEHAINGNWGGRIDLTKGRVVWKQPMTLDLTGGIRMTDARPLLAIFEANRKTNRWLDRILDLKNIRGDATIKVAPNEIAIPYAFAKSDTIDLGAKGIFRKNDRQGMFYARYGALSGILAIDNSQKRFELLKATKKFDDYVPGGPLHGPTRSGPARKGPLSIFQRN